MSATFERPNERTITARVELSDQPDRREGYAIAVGKAAEAAARLAAHDNRTVVSLTFEVQPRHGLYGYRKLVMEASDLVATGLAETADPRAFDSEETS